MAHAAVRLLVVSGAVLLLSCSNPEERVYENERPWEGQPHLEVGEQTTVLVAMKPRFWGGSRFVEAGFRNLGAPLEVAIGRHHACVQDQGTVRCWGSALSGQLSAVEPSQRCLDRPCAVAPVVVDGLPPVAELVAGAFHTCGVDVDGTVWCWGDTLHGQTGPDAGEDAHGPVAVSGLSGVQDIAAGFLHTCAVDVGGAVWCWGNADDGRLGGAPDSGDEAGMVRVNGLDGPATAVSAGVAHSCALLADGTVMCWGSNRFGQLGDGTTGGRPTPDRVIGLAEKVVEVAAGDHFTCARSEGGGVWCWGWNDLGQLGQGSFDGPAEPGGFSASTRPVRVGGLPGPAASLAAGAGHACALVGGAAWCWGRNEVGQLGDGTVEDRAAPVRSAAADGRVGPPARRRAPSGRTGGFDVSYHSGRVDWQRVGDDGHGFAFTLSTAGEDFHDPLFFPHWVRMPPLRRGAYHFFVAHDDPVRQARWFIANTPLGPGDLAPVVDIETLGDDPPGDLDDRLRVFVERLRHHYGVTPIVYTGPTFWNDHLGGGYGDHPLWIAEYEVDRPKVPDGWTGWSLWQNRGNAAIPGVERVVDLNVLADGVALDQLVIPEAGP